MIKGLKAAATVLAAAVSGTSRGMASPERPAARTEEPEYEADIERDHATLIDQMVEQNILSGKAAAATLAYTEFASARNPAPKHITKAPPASSDIEDSRFPNQFDEAAERADYERGQEL